MVSGGAWTTGFDYERWCESVTDDLEDALRKLYLAIGEVAEDPEEALERMSDPVSAYTATVILTTLERIPIGWTKRRGLAEVAREAMRSSE